MSWQVGSFGLLGIALAAGFAWYERTRPDARLVALVGTLAAFAALGRIAFAVLPNVKPTTDIVLISGYALGGAPGFVVGAVAGLTSNFFFGQGPWTPWQMGAWGATGVLGAALAVVTRRRMPRWPLALVCAVAGFSFTAFQDVGDWVTYSDHSPAQLGVYVGKGIGFDFVHAGGCLVFALIFGPALTRSLQRFATRLTVSWRPALGTVPPAAGMFVVAACVAGLAGLAGATPARAGAATPESYLLAAQGSDGGYGAAPGQPSDAMYSAWAALGLASEGVNPLGVSHGGPSLFAYVSSGTGPSADSGSLERTILVLRAAGSSAGGDLVAALARRFGRDGSISDQVNLTAFGVLALRAAGAGVSPATIGWLTRQQNSDGGFSFATAGAPSDVDDTAAALEGLARAGGPGASARGHAVHYILAQQNRDGGLPQQGGEDSNTQSTAWAVQGLIAAGVDPGSLHRAGAPSPLQYLDSLIASDGHVRYSRGNDQTPVWVTGEAAMALAAKPLPLPPLAAPAGGAAAPGRGRARSGGGAAAQGGARAGAAATAPARAQERAASRARRGAGGALRPVASRVLAQLAGDAGLATAILMAPVGVS